MSALHRLLLLVLPVFFLLPFPASAQKEGQELIDSLVAALPKMAEDTNKVHALGDISFNYRLIDYTKGIDYGNECLALAKKIGWQKGIGKAYNVLGNCYKANSNYPMALKYFHRALAIYERENLDAAQAIILMNIGTVYRPLKKYDKALSYYDKALVLARKTKNRKLQAQLLGNKGVIYFESKQFERQRQVSLEALAIFREIGDSNNEAWILSNLGDTYAEIGDYDKGIAEHQRAIAIYEALGNDAYKATSLLSIGRILNKKAEGVKNDPAEQKKLLETAISYLRQAEVILKALDDIDYLKDVYLHLSTAQRLLGEHDAALKSYEAYTLYKDSVFSQEMQENIAQLETQREIEVRDREIEIEALKKRTEFLYFAGGIAFLLIIIVFTVRSSRRQKKQNALLSIEKQKSEDLLHNILPEEVAAELKTKGAADARLFDEVTVLFTDFKDFTQVAEQLTPQELVAEIDACFSAFDHIMEKHNVEKIKTIGDAYMAAGGLPVANRTNAVDVVNAALEIRRFMEALSVRRQSEGKTAFRIRIGVHSGPVVAGIVGVKKFAYDIWGDTVNTAARMESSGEVGKVNISGTTFEQVKETFTCTYRGKIEAKNKGEIDMYFVE